MTVYDEERTAYVEGMKKYTEDLLKMPKEQAMEEDLDGLYLAGIVTKEGELTTHYRKNLDLIYQEERMDKRMGNSDIFAEIASALRTYRKKNGLSQRQFSQICGVNPSTIARLERQEANPRLNTVVKVLAAAGMRLVIVPMDDSGFTEN